MYYPDKPSNPAKHLPEMPLLSMVQLLVVVLWMLSFVEHFKALVMWLAKSCTSSSTNALMSSRSLAIDLYECLKWSFLLIVFAAHIFLDWVVGMVFYLLISNLFSHFYYHVWFQRPEAKISHNSVKRRLTSFLLAFTFMIFGYAYLYLGWYPNEIRWPSDDPNITNALYLSFANTFTLTYGDFGPQNDGSRFLFISQVIYTFFFLVLIVVRSLPNSE